MSERLRPERDPAHGAPDGASNDDGALDAAREAAEQYLRAAGDAISRTLSGNSEQFIAASRQRGGQ